MCGKAALNYTWRQIYELYRLTAPEPSSAPNLQPRYNVTRYQTVPVVRPTEEGRELVPMLWEFIPFWGFVAQNCEGFISRTRHDSWMA